MSGEEDIDDGEVEMIIIRDVFWEAWEAERLITSTFSDLTTKCQHSALPGQRSGGESCICVLTS